MQDKVITVSYQEETVVFADTIAIRFSAAGEAKKYAAAVQQATAKTNDALSALAAVGITRVTLVGSSVSATHNGEGLSGYRAVTEYEVKHEYDNDFIEKVTEALESGECEWRIQYSLKNDDYRNGLLEAAVENARKKAKAIARAAGVKLGKLCRADYSSGGMQPRVMMMRASAMNGAAEVEPAKITLSESVTCSWEIE